jgi:hypothetical protein
MLSKTQDLPLLGALVGRFRCCLQGFIVFRNILPFPFAYRDNGMVHGPSLLQKSVNLIDVGGIQSVGALMLEEKHHNCQ